jgi:hypothetical protein
MPAVINTPRALKKATKIDEATWELHRSTITRLYVEKRLEGEDGLIDTMTKKYEFTARYVAQQCSLCRALTLSSKSQYEGRFREWNLRKNLKRKDWQSVIKHVHKRARIGKESEVRFNGAVLSNEKVAREALRYGWTRDSQINASEGIYATPYDLVVYISSLDIESNLPEDVTVCTPPSVGAEDETSQTLHQVSRDPITNQSYYHERQDHSTQMIGVGTGLWRVMTYGFKPLREQFQPFAWFSTLDWKSIPESMIQSLQPDQEHTPTSTHIAAMFCPVEEITSAPKNQYNYPAFHGSTTAIQYSMASILNKSGSSTFDPYYWLRGIPWPIAARIFGGLPAPIRDVFRERMFAEAIMNDDGTLVKAMLELGMDPLERINIGGYNETPSVYATGNGKLSALKVLILHMIKTDARKELEHLLPVVLSVTKDKVFRGPVSCVRGEGIELIRLILSSGAKATLESFKMATEHYTLWNELMEVQEDGIYGWLQNGLFLGCIKSVTVFGGSDHFAFCDWVLQEILSTNAEKDSVIDDKIEAALSDAFKFFVNAGLVDRAQALFKTCVTIKVRLLYPTSEDTSGNSTIAQACRSMDLDLLRKWIDDSSSDHLRCSSPSTISRELEQAVFPNRHHPEATPESIYQAVLNDDLFYIESELNCSVNHKNVDGRWDLGFHQAAQLGRDKIAIAILQHPVMPANLVRNGVSVLLSHGRIFPLSECVCTYPQVRQALVSATTESNYDRLDDLLRQSVSFSKPLKPPNSSGNFDSRSRIDKSPGTFLGALACHAIHHDDSKLLEWLLEFGVEIHWHFSTAHVQGESGPYPSPPLLGIAAAHGKIQVVRYLLEREGKDNLPFALSWVIQSQASAESASILLNEFKSPEINKVTRSYSRPLRHAIRNRDYNLIRLLARSADINYIVQEIHRDLWLDNSHGDSSPLGEAVSTQDLEATTIMLENGGDPNMLALILLGSQNQSKNRSPGGAFLGRSTSIIAAIDTKSLPMVQLLVQRHSDAHKSPRSGLVADINHPPRLGLIRTPLQRAAETGCFDIVQYLVEQGAEIDLAPCYGGGTALQLAAMQGHVGIAAFLLERGADPNFPPARGPGRTAFEAAAEWNRIDMLSLLMKWGCRLEIDIANDPDERPYNHPNIPYYYPGKRYGEDSDVEVETDQHQPPTSTQYERAMRFAKNSGHMACKRFIEHLYQKCAESTPDGYWDPESFTNAEQDLDWNPEFWSQVDLEI